MFDTITKKLLVTISKEWQAWDKELRPVYSKERERKMKNLKNLHARVLRAYEYAAKHRM